MSAEKYGKGDNAAVESGLPQSQVEALDLRISDLEGRLKSKHSLMCVCAALVVGIAAGMSLGHFLLAEKMQAYLVANTLADVSETKHMPMQKNPSAWCPVVGDPLGALRAAQPKGQILVDISTHGPDASVPIRFAETGHKVISFEGSPAKYPDALQAISESGQADNVDFQQVAVGKSIGEGEYWVTEGGSSQDQLAKPPWPDAQALWVEVDTLDNLIGNQEILLLYVQGSEPDVIAGARNLIKEGKVQVIAMHIAPGIYPQPDEYVKVLDFLYAYGYICYDCQTEMTQKVEERSFGTFSDSKELIEFYMKHEFQFRGVDIHGWGDVVCVYYP